MRRLVPALAVVAAFSFNLCVGAQQVYSVNSQQDEKKDKGRDKKNKKDAADDAVFSQAVANRVLTTLRDGLEGHSERLMLSVFDRDKMDGYLTLEDQIRAMFERYESFRVHYRIMQSTVEGSKGVVLAEFELEEIPRAGGTPQRRQGQLKFEMERGRKGWKIVDFNPRGFFS